MKKISMFVTRTRIVNASTPKYDELILYTAHAFLYYHILTHIAHSGETRKQQKESDNSKPFSNGNTNIDYEILCVEGWFKPCWLV